MLKGARDFEAGGAAKGQTEPSGDNVGKKRLGVAAVSCAEVVNLAKPLPVEALHVDALADAPDAARPTRRSSKRIKAEAATPAAAAAAAAAAAGKRGSSRSASAAGGPSRVNAAPAEPSIPDGEETYRNIDSASPPPPPAPHALSWVVCTLCGKRVRAFSLPAHQSQWGCRRPPHRAAAPS